MSSVALPRQRPKRKKRRLVISSLRFFSFFDSNGQHRRNVPVPTVPSRHQFSLRSTVVRRLFALSDELRTRNDADATTRLQPDVLRRRDAFADLSESESDVRRFSQRAGRGRRSAIGASVCHPGRKHSSESTALRSSIKEKMFFSINYNRRIIVEQNRVCLVSHSRLTFLIATPVRWFIDPVT